ncbi:hypothetical protein R6Q57_029953 [Mikania cordata]
MTKVDKNDSVAPVWYYTRKSTNDQFSSGVLKILLLAFLVGFSAWSYQTALPPPPRKLGMSITSPRIKLRDGRHVSYIEHGVPKDIAKSKIIYVHCFGCSKYHNPFAITTSQAVLEELGVYIVAIDRAGYGESDPDPKRTVKSLVLAGAILVSPAVNFWWHNLPSNLTNEAYSRLLPQNQWSLRVAHYAPWLTYWWNTRTWLPSFSTISSAVLSSTDKEIASKLFATMDPNMESFIKSQPTLQGEFESLHRDMNIGFGKWEFDPIDLENPFPKNDGYVHLWMGDEDLLVPVTLQSYIAQRLGWIKYHEIMGEGHLFAFKDGMGDTILKELFYNKN